MVRQTNIIALFVLSLTTGYNHDGKYVTGLVTGVWNICNYFLLPYAQRVLHNDIITAVTVCQAGFAYSRQVVCGPCAIDGEHNTLDGGGKPLSIRC